VGTYLNVWTKEETDEAAQEANRRWREFAKEETDKGLLTNGCDYGECGYTLNFITDKDNEETAQWAMDVERYECITTDMSLDEAVVALKKFLPGVGWTQLGSCQFKLSGGNHPCIHRLEKAVKFLEANKDLVEWDGVDNYEEILEYGGDYRSESYCEQCVKDAQADGVELPIRICTECRSWQELKPFSGVDDRITHRCPRCFFFYHAEGETVELMIPVKKPKITLANVSGPVLREGSLWVPLVRMDDNMTRDEATVVYHLLKSGYTMKEVREVRNIPTQWTKKAVIEYIKRHGFSDFANEWNDKKSVWYYKNSQTGEMIEYEGV